MGNLGLENRLYMALNKELMRRQLIRYFIGKGFRESFNKKIYPPLLQDLPQQVPSVATKVEIVPFVEDVDPNTGIISLGWNLFVLGNRRMFLGESTHTSLSEVMQFGGIGEKPPHYEQATPRRLINFVLRVLGKDKRGIEATLRGKNIRTPIPGLGMGDMTGHFFTKNRQVT